MARNCTRGRFLEEAHRSKRIFEMKKKSILVLGAGRSSSALIKYLLAHAEGGNWHVTVGDFNVRAAEERIKVSQNGTAIRFNIEEAQSCGEVVASSDVVISLLPADFHHKVAGLCLAYGKHLFNASYVSEKMQSFDKEAKEKGLLFMNECGLDPGIDHMSAMEIIEGIKTKGGKVLSFESFTGGLIAPETDVDNPWRYKFTWNPRNVVMAGHGTAKFIQENQYKFISYQQLFSRTTPVHIPDYGNFEGYANRDSLKYMDTYGLRGVKTLLRGTLRNEGFCPAWNILVQLGCTDDSYMMENVGTMTHRDFINTFLPYDDKEMVEGKLLARFGLDGAGPEMLRLKWSGFFDTELVGLTAGTPAQVLEHILNKRWKLAPQDKDMVVMWHRFVYQLGGKAHEIQSHIIMQGDDAVDTAMAKGVGLPLGIAAKLFLEGKISQRGVCIPVSKELYGPLLEELKSLGIHASEVERALL